MQAKIETYQHLNIALDGEVLVDIGQVGPLCRKSLDQAVRAGKLVKVARQVVPAPRCVSWCRPGQELLVYT